MLRVVTGPFHPDLEDTLITDIVQAKQTDPSAPLAVVVPSKPLRDRIRQRLIAEEGCACLNLHLLTFHQLALRLADERRVAGPRGREPDLTVVSDLVSQYLIERLAAPMSPGAAAARWATLRDLKDGGVDARTALGAVAEGVFDADDAEPLQQLFELYATVSARSQELGLGGVDDLTALVTDWALRSAFLTSLRSIHYYGFYDITQVQLSLLEAIAKAAPVLLYFPLKDGRPFEFARKFFERHVARIAGEIVPLRPAASASGPAIVQRFTVAGAEAEVTLVCKEILTLVETHGYRFDEIGVVARTLEPYQPLMRAVFDRHRIPFISSAGRPAAAEPAIKTLLQLARVPATAFARAPLLDVLTSPFYRSPAGGEVRSDVLRRTVAALGIRRGEADWRRLACAGDLMRSDGDTDGVEPRVPLPSKDEVARLAAVVGRLIDDGLALPRQGTVDELTVAFLALARTHLTMLGLNDDEPSSDPLADAIGSIFMELRQLDRLGGTISWSEWVALLERVVDRSRLPLASAEMGVQVLDAMAARGLPFRALFVIGLNEKVFPRYIREDAFLRDRARRVLDETLGFKVDQKLAGYDEELLLATLLVGAARQRLTLIWQRADAAGRPLAPSGYVTDGTFPTASDGATIAIPRRLSERRGHPQFAPPMLTPDELGLAMIVDGLDPGDCFSITGRDRDLFAGGVGALAVLEQGRGALGPYDGDVGAAASAHWDRLTSRGVSPTPLESYARCPFQYFARHVLRLEMVRVPEPDELPAQIVGQLIHATLRLCGERLLAAGWPAREQDGVQLRAHAASAAEAVFSGYADLCGTGYPLLWDMTRETVVALVAASFALDADRWREIGTRPVQFEVEAAGTLPGIMADPIPLRGRLDRIDQMASGGVRIVDYKFQVGAARKSQDGDLLQSAVRGFRLQPALYALLDLKGGRPIEIEFRLLAPGRMPPVETVSFSSSAWTGPAAPRLQATLYTLLEGIRSGRYFMLPDGYCDYCEMTSACRRHHAPSWWRTYTAAPSRALRELRTVKIKHEKGSHD